MTTWAPVPDGSDFPLNNLPFGVFSAPDGSGRRIGVAIGRHVLDVGAVFDEPSLQGPTLDGLLAGGRPTWARVRDRIGTALSSDTERARVEPHLQPMTSVRMHLPFTVGDYVDFYSSRRHAENLGRILRPDGDPLTPNWLHLPIGYHGRAGTVVVSGTPVVRPSGQSRLDPDAPPRWGPTTRLDYEAEVGFVVGTPSPLGAPVPTQAIDEHVFGVVLVNDWSARDLQAWEYAPLGPFLGKSFATTVSPWVVPLDALRAARVEPPQQDPEPLAYLRPAQWGLDLTLSVELNGEVVSRPPFAGTYWTPAQQLAHLTANGAALRTGDLFASGTVSGDEADEWGSLMERTRGGTEPLTLQDGTSRTFLEDGDRVVLTASAPAPDGGRIGFGEAAGTVRPAREHGHRSG